MFLVQTTLRIRYDKDLLREESRRGPTSPPEIRMGNPAGGGEDEDEEGEKAAAEGEGEGREGEGEEAEGREGEGGDGEEGEREHCWHHKIRDTTMLLYFRPTFNIANNGWLVKILVH